MQLKVLFNTLILKKGLTVMRFKGSDDISCLLVGSKYGPKFLSISPLSAAKTKAPFIGMALGADEKRRMSN